MKKKIIGFSITAIFVALIGWGMVEPYLLEVEEETAEIESLPPSWEGKKIIAAGDFQVGMWMDNASNLEDVVKEIIDRDPDAVVLLGDYVYHSVENHEIEMEKVISYLTPLAETDIPVYAVLGNHDYNMSSSKAKPDMETAARVKEELKSIDIEVLQNESVPLTIESTDQPLHLVGIGARWPENDDISEAFDEIGKEESRFTFMHNPNTFPEIPADRAPTVVAGHTHGGQVSIPYMPHWSWKNLIANEEAHVDGWATDDYGAEGNRLYVNRGIGLSLLPIRVNNFPEITEFRLSDS